MTAAAQDIETAIPDLTGTALDKLAEHGGPVLAEAVATYRARLKETGMQASNFQARI